MVQMFSYKIAVISLMPGPIFPQKEYPVDNQIDNLL